MCYTTTENRGKNSIRMNKMIGQIPKVFRLIKHIIVLILFLLPSIDSKALSKIYKAQNYSE